MRRAKLQRDTERISLFPFLAVLICTMGALLVLLVVLAKRAQARAQAEQVEANQQSQQDREAVEAQLATLNAEIERLEQFRQQAAAALTGRRQALSHVEDHLRRLAEQLAELRETALRLQAAKEQDDGDLDKVRTELERVQQQLAESEQLLEESLKDASEKKRSYSIVPYRGPNETFRRPIYIECQAESVVLQPEGIVLNEHDFLRPQGPDNPLAATLRSVAQFISRQPSSAGSEPYPLLLVRPDGIAAYYAARAALKSWDADFGYELIGKDWKLQFPAADPGLARVAQETLLMARRRHQLMVKRHAAGQLVSGDRAFGRLVEPSNGMAGRASGQDPHRKNTDGPFGEGNGGDSDRKPTGEPPPHGSHDGDDPQESRSNSSPGAAGRPGGGEDAPGGVPGGNLANGGLKPVAEVRGSNWALPDATKGAVPFTRPIRIECAADRIMIAAGDSRVPDKVIALPGPTRDAVEEFVSSVWAHMQGWGIAGHGMYWRPVLNIYVVPGGQQRAAQLETLLEDSGLDVQLK